jgi:hypothetical protein
MRSIFLAAMLLTVFLSNLSHANYTDSGWIRFKQPDGTTFIGRIFGDEFEFQNVTKEGYAFEKNSEDGFYYYAKGVEVNRYILSNLKVGLEKASGIDVEKNLKVRMDFMYPEVPTVGKAAPQNQKLLATTNYTLKVILVEFSDVSGGPQVHQIRL